jgi:hypothetical protein
MHRGEGCSAISSDPTPVLQPQTARFTLEAAERYRRIADNGGWPALTGRFDKMPLAKA